MNRDAIIRWWNDSVNLAAAGKLSEAGLDAFLTTLEVYAPILREAIPGFQETCTALADVLVDQLFGPPCGKCRGCLAQRRELAVC